MIRQPSELKNSNIWEQAGKAKKKDKGVSGQQKTVIIVGDPSVGKTSFIRILRGDLDFQTKPTCLLEYSYIKKMAIRKQLIHCYEVATKSLTEVISSLITKDNFADVYLVLCIDLGKPGGIVDQVIDWMRILRKESESFLNDKMMTREQRYQRFQSDINERLTQSQDRSSINPMPLNTILLGCKYDQLQKFDTENRKWVTRALRFLAHTNNCSLFFSSTKNMQVSAQLRNIVGQCFFGDKKSQFSGQKDHTKPIFIQWGQDNIASMNLPSSGGSLSTIEILKKQIVSLFPIEAEKKKQPTDSNKYLETRIDILIEQKKRQLAKINKSLQNNDGFAKR